MRTQRTGRTQNAARWSPWATGTTPRRPPSASSPARQLPRGARAGLVLPEIAAFSGDTVRRDEEGYLHFIGRRDEMIKTSGYRVSPTEVEEILYGTKLVGECAAFGVAHDTLGQSIVVIATAPAGGTLDNRRAARRMSRAHAGLHGARPHRGARRPTAAQP